MACYFLIDTYIDEARGRGEYDQYIEEVRPMVEQYGGAYLLRTEQVTGISAERQPQRLIVIRISGNRRKASWLGGCPGRNRRGRRSRTR